MSVNFQHGDEPPAELAAALAAALEAAAAGGQLRELELVAGLEWHKLDEERLVIPLPTAWLPAMPTLQRLTMEARVDTWLPSTHHLTALESLQRSGTFLHGGAATQATSITHLQLGSDDQEAVVPQVRA